MICVPMLPTVPQLVFAASQIPELRLLSDEFRGDRVVHKGIAALLCEVLYFVIPYQDRDVQKYLSKAIQEKLGPNRVTLGPARDSHLALRFSIFRMVQPGCQAHCAGMGDPGGELREMQRQARDGLLIRTQVGEDFERVFSFEFPDIALLHTPLPLPGVSQGEGTDADAVLRTDDFKGADYAIEVYFGVLAGISDNHIPLPRRHRHALR